MYSFPNEEECFLRFLDTRGLGEAGQDGLAEIPRLEAEADLIIVVVKAMDHAQQPVLDILRGVVARHPDWPILVLQTALHEGYPAGHPEYRVPAEYRVPRGVPAAPRHVLPYPYAEPPYPPSVPHDLARSLLAQRELFRDYRDRFVPVDFTLPEDGFEPVDYGLEQLWSVIEELLPLGLRGMLGQTPEARQAVRDDLFRKAQPHIVAYAMAAGGAGAVPLPAVDVPLVLTAQARMLYKIAEIYRQPMDITRMAEIAGALGIGFLTRLGAPRAAETRAPAGTGRGRLGPVCGRFDLRPGRRLVPILRPRSRRREARRGGHSPALRRGIEGKQTLDRRADAASVAPQGTRPMIRGVAKIRAAIALVLLSIPYVLLFAAGSIWLFRNNLLLGWAGLSLAFTAAGWCLLRGLWHKAQPPQVQPDPSWPPQGVEAWKQVERLAAEVEAEDLPLDRPETLAAVVRRVADVVARHYHPDAADPWLETPFPHALRIVELVARDLRRATLGYVPGSHILTIGDLRRLQRLAGMARRSYFWYRIASFVINTPAAFVREARDTVFGQLKDMSTEAVRRWAVGYFVRRTGYYAIQLYSGQMVLEDAQPDDAPLRQSKRDAGQDLQRTGLLDREPLRILVVGQKKSGKSSLINALFGQYRAATDVVPRTDQVEPYVLEYEGLEQAIVLDTAGYDVADPGAACSSPGSIICTAATWSFAFARPLPPRGRPTAVSQRAAGRIPAEPGPPLAGGDYGPDAYRSAASAAGVGPALSARSAEGPKAEQIADAVEAVAADLALPPADVIPVCLLPERIYNVEEALIPAMLDRLPAAQRVKYVRCLRQQRDEQYWRRLWQQTVAAGRVLRDWMQSRKKLPLWSATHRTAPH